MAVDGLSLPLVILTTLLSVLSVAGSSGLRTDQGIFSGSFAWTGMLGVLWRSTFPVLRVLGNTWCPYFLIGSGRSKKEYAAIKFSYTLFGSVFMLVAMLALFPRVSPSTGQLMQQNRQFVGLFQYVAFVFCSLRSLSRCRCFRFIPAPAGACGSSTAVSVILAGVF